MAYGFRDERVEWTRSDFEMCSDIRMALTSLNKRQQKFCRLTVTNNSTRMAARAMKLSPDEYQKMLDAVKNEFLKKRLTHYFTELRKQETEKTPKMERETIMNPVDAAAQEKIRARFYPKFLTSRQESILGYIGDSAVAFAMTLHELCPPSEELTAALDHFDVVLANANAAVVRGSATETKGGN